MFLNEDRFDDKGFEVDNDICPVCGEVMSNGRCPNCAMNETESVRLCTY
jgi:rubrerythrin